ncbi:DUF6531 domain-containing protein [Actinacidiphila sp. bgisy144]|uniref:DUF6531 domain-containing protein n=1 Tax=Actinacidiphila sp. bgisy144 TaxID=3413791 RepID=UPI003EBF8423
MLRAVLVRVRLLSVLVVLSVLAGGGWLAVLPTTSAAAASVSQVDAAHVPKPAAPEKPLSLAQRRDAFGGQPAAVKAHGLPAGKGEAPTPKQTAKVEQRLAKQKQHPAAAERVESPADSGPYTGLVSEQISTDPLGNQAAYTDNPICLCDRMGAAVPGEPLVETASIYQYGDNTTTQESQPVKVTWEVTDYCTGGPNLNFDFDQTVSAPNWMTHDQPGAPDPPTVSAVIPLPAQVCTANSQWTYIVNACAQVMTDPPGAVTCGSSNDFLVLPFLPADGTNGCTCGDASGAPRSDVQRADPVDTATGAYSEQFTDASVTGVGVPFTAARSYGSNVAAVGALGKGWSLPWETSLQVDSAGNVLVRGEGGALHGYTKQSNGSFTPADGGTSVLATASGGGYTLTSLDHITYTFAADGHLSSEKDASGQGLTLTYTGGVPTTITDAAGRDVSLSYTGALLTKITLADGRHVDYGYTGSQLTSVTALDGATTTYGYDSAGRLNTVTDALQHRQVFNVYDTQGRVTSQTDADDRQTTFAYTTTSVFDETDTTAPDGGVWSDFYAGNMRYAQEDPLGNVTLYEYDAHYNLTDLLDADGHDTSWKYNDNGLLKSTKTDGLQQWTYDSSGNPATYEDADYHTTKFTYGANHLLTQVADPLQNSTDYTYWPNGELKTATTPRGKTTQYAYFPDGSLQQVTSPEGRVTSYTYDTSGRLRTETDPRGNVTGADPAKFTTTYTYDDADRLLSVTDANNHTTTTKYDAAGNIHTVTDPAERVTTYGYDDADHVTSITDPAQHTTHYGYDLAGRPDSVTDRTGATTSTTYDAAGNIASTVTARGNATGADKSAYTWTYGYDHVGNRTSTTDPLGHTTAFAYDTVNRPLGTTDPNGHTRKVTYDLDGNVTFQYDALGHTVTRFDYDADNRLEDTRTGAGNKTTYEYDDDSNLTGVLTPAGEHTTYGYDDDGLRTTTVDPRGNTTGATAANYTWTTGYDPAGNPTSLTDPDGNTTRTGYDGVDNVTSTTDALSKTTSYTYDALDRLTTTAAPASGTTTYAYDPATGFLDTITDPNTHVTTYGHDNEGRVTSITDPLSHTESFAYDPEGNLWQTKNARGQTITATLDARDLTQKVTYSDSTPAVTYTYDDAGRMQTVADATGTRTLTYYANDQLESIGTTGQLFSYTYNSDQTLNKRTDPDGASTAYTYDTDGRVHTETAAEPGSAGKTTTYAYDAAGNPTSTALPTTPALTQTRAYDAAGRLDSLQTTGQEGHFFQYDADGHLTTDFTGSGAHGESYDAARRYAYDDAGRVTRDCTDNAEAASCLDEGTGHTYTYDNAGNLATSADTDVPCESGTCTTQTTTNTYNAADELTKATPSTATVTNGTPSQPKAGAATSYTYDNDGNQTQAGATTNTYDPAGHLTTATTGATTHTYGYDADGNRTTTKTNGTLTDTTTWDINNPQAQIATETGTGNALVGDYFYDPQGAPQSVATNATTSYSYLHDQRGSVTAVVNATGALTSEYTYGTFGTSTENPNDPAGGEKSAFGFTGAYNDPTQTGALDLRARTLDTTTGRFTTRDPVATTPGNPNPSDYAYADNDPVNESDPSGACPVCISALVGAGIGGLVSGGIYAWQHHDGDWNWSDFAATTAKGAVIGFGAGLLAPVGGTSAALLGFEDGTAAYYATAATVNGLTQAAYTWAVNAVQCQSTTPQDLLFSFAGGFGGTYAGAAFPWLRGLFGDGSEEESSAPGLERRTSNTGPFSDLQVPMQKRVVNQVARKAGVDLGGVKVTINRDSDLIGRSLYGHTSPDGRTITLYPDAFGSTEDLVRTIGHERMHVMQVGLYGPASSWEQERSWERAAFASEDQFWNYFNGGSR